MIELGGEFTERNSGQDRQGSDEHLKGYTTKLIEAKTNICDVTANMEMPQSNPIFNYQYTTAHYPDRHSQHYISDLSLNICVEDSK